MNPLDNLIRTIDCPSSENVDSSSEKLVRIDANTGELQHQRSSWWNIGQKTRCYLVSTQNSAEHEVSECKVRDVGTDRAININIAYVASCEVGNEEKVVLVLSKGDNPTAVLDDLMRAWVKDFARLKGGGNFIDGYFQQDLKKQLEIHLCKEALEKTGLTLETRLSLKDEEKIKPLPINSQFFPVRVKDYGEELGLKIKEALLQIHEESKINIVATDEQPSQLLQWLQDESGVFLREHATLHEFCYQLQTGLRDKLTNHFNSRLPQRGRKMTSLFLESNEASALRPGEESQSFEYEVNCTIKEYQTAIRVEHKVLMNLDNLGKYKVARIDDLKLFLKGKIEKITRTRLLEKSYADVVIDFFDTQESSIEHDIKRALEDEAKLIGYSVKHLVVIPNLEPLTLKRDGIFFEENGEFVTKDTRVPVKLSIVVKADMRSLEGVKNYLNPRASILEKIKEETINHARFLIHGIDPERFYMRFRFSDRPEEIAVEQELRDGIVQTLKERFQLENISVTPKLVETELTKRFQKLLEDFHDFEVVCLPIREGGKGEPVKFTGTFKVWTVDKDGWYAFQTNNYQSTVEEIEALKKRLTQDIKSKLEVVPNIFLKWHDQQTKNNVNEIIRYSVEEVKRDFGLVIEVSSLLRSLTEEEQANLRERESRLERLKEQQQTEEEMAKITHVALLSELNGLLEKRKQLRQAGYFDEDPEVMVTEKRIEAVTGKPPTYSMVVSPSPSQSDPPPSPLDFDFEEHLKSINPQKSLPGATTSKKIGKETTAEKKNEEDK